MFKNKFLMVSALLLIFLTMGMVQASDNSTDDFSLDEHSND